MASPLYLGIDIGSVTVKAVVLDAQGRLVASRYVPAQGRPRQTLARVLHALEKEIDLSALAAAGLTGSGGGPIARRAGIAHVNEIVAQVRAVRHYHPDARTVIEIGGQDSKLLILEHDPHTGQPTLADFGMNALCAAGTGSFLDQQAERLGVQIKDEFAALALQSTSPASVAGRCTVFAKTDMIHLQQRGVTVPDILAGLCYALARNFKSVIGRGKRFARPILFQGGVACNEAVIRAFEDVLDLEAGQLIIPHHHRLMAAIGAALGQIDAAGADGPPSLDMDRLFAALAEAPAAERALPPLQWSGAPHQWEPPSLNGGERHPVYLGIDVGSISTNLVLIDQAGELVARRYLRTAGRPLEAVQAGLLDLGREVGDRVRVCGVGATGSGRYLTGAYAGADVVSNEITAQARAAAEIDPTVDTVFEIGGQDSKYIRLADGVVVDFAMNRACAAGTGSFLEEQADRLQIDIEREFGRLALDAAAPAPLGERCTVFMESDLVHCQQQGAAVPDLAAGLAYSIAHNYLNRVVNGRAVGERIFFQGGVAGNEGVVAAFAALTGAEVIVPPHHDVTGAIGAALLARERVEGETGFHGFDLRQRAYSSEAFECGGCPNHCEITRVRFGADRPLFYGARCDRYDGNRANTSSVAVKKPSRAFSAQSDFFARREALLLEGYDPPAERSHRPRVGVPRTLLFYELFPYWHRLLVELGAEVVISEGTNPRIVRDTWEHTPAETCFPVKLMQGHALDLIGKGVDYLWLPSIATREDPAPGQSNNKHCPFIQAVPHLVLQTLRPQERGVSVLSGALHLDDRRAAERDLRALLRPLGVSARQVRAAMAAAEGAQRAFQAEVRALWDKVQARMETGERVAVLVGRPYNTCDAGVSMALPYKLRKLGVTPVPMDVLPLAEVDTSGQFDNMFWHSGQALLAAADLIRREPRLHAIYVTNFGCGPDSFLLSFFRRAMGERLYLELELDDHTADAGVNTRCEAFFDSLAAVRV